MKKEIWTFLETEGKGELRSTSKELLAKAKIIAAAAEEEEKYVICALFAGADHEALISAAEKALGTGADKAVLIEGDELSVYSAEFYSDAIGRTAETERPEMILFERTTDGMDLAPRLAARLGTGMISDCVDLEKENGKLLWIRHAFGGTAAVSVSFREQEVTQIISIRPGSFGGAGRGAKAAEPAAAQDAQAGTGAVAIVPYKSADSGCRAAGEILRHRRAPTAAIPLKNRREALRARPKEEGRRALLPAVIMQGRQLTKIQARALRTPRVQSGRIPPLTGRREALPDIRVPMWPRWLTRATLKARLRWMHR